MTPTASLSAIGTGRDKGGELGVEPVRPVPVSARLQPLPDCALQRELSRQRVQRLQLAEVQQQAGGDSHACVFCVVAMRKTIKSRLR